MAAKTSRKFLGQPGREKLRKHQPVKSEMRNSVGKSTICWLEGGTAPALDSGQQPGQAAQHSPGSRGVSG